MLGLLDQPGETAGMPPRWDRTDGWNEMPAWGWLHIASDVAIAVAIAVISVALVYLLRRRNDLPFSRVLWLFVLLAVAGGATHVVDALLFWWPAYRFWGLVKLATAAVAWGAVIALILSLPAALKLRSPVQLAEDVLARTQELKSANARLDNELRERQRYEQRLRNNEQQSRMILEAGRMGTWEWNLQTHDVKIDAPEALLFGIGEEPAIVKIQEIFARVCDEDLAELREKIRTSIQQRIRYEHEFRVALPTGGIRWLCGRGDVTRDERDRPVMMMGVNFDVTARRNAEEDLRIRNRALQSATNGILITDAQEPDCPISYVNSAFEQLTGYTEAEVLGRNCRFLQGPDTDPATIAEIRRALAEKSECHVTLLNYRKDGTPFWNELRITPLFDDHDRVSHFVGVQADATERKEFEQSLQRAEAQAYAASQAKSEFLANMSHEIRTPLTAVLGCADTLYPRVVMEEHREMVQMIRTQGRLLLTIINDILDLSKIEAGRLDIHREPVSIVAVIEEVRSLLAPQAVEKSLSLTTRYLTDMPAEIPTDPLRVRQILINLVGNAIKFTESGEVAVAVRCNATAEVPELQIEVRDTGMGIPRERLRAIFDAFTQEHGSTNLARKFGGTGLGLTISEKLVQMLGGRISVVSEVGQGTTFAVRLPLGIDGQLKLKSAVRLAEEAATQQRSHDTIDVLLPLRVLVAEDTRGIQFMIRRMLEDAGATVAVVENGQRAIDEVLRSERDGTAYELILMDMQMPVLTGFDATARLREAGCRTPIIALTAAAMHGDRERCLQAGCDDYLPKPIDRNTLLSTLFKHYNRRPASV